MGFDEFLDYAKGDRDFAEWLNECNEYCEKVTDLHILDDFDDALWRDEYTAGSGPEIAVRKLLAEDETFCRLLAAFEGEYDIDLDDNGEFHDSQYD